MFLKDLFDKTDKFEHVDFVLVLDGAGYVVTSADLEIVVVPPSSLLGVLGCVRFLDDYDAFGFERGFFLFGL